MGGKELKKGKKAKSSTEAPVLEGTLERSQ